MDKIERRKRRKGTVRKKIVGTAEKPRLCLYKGAKNIFAQLIDDFAGKTLCGLSTHSKAIKDKMKTATKKNVSSAGILGEELAKAAVKKGVKKVVFDRSGYQYHGRVKAFAEAARKNGLEF
ncbi:MAG TPA: 50S ribosomal protein L18 [Candidatus Omnitrophota bacterium]|nr:50S ribosomal protein L18 [Candidatus Omnitrophota bacterium]